MKLDSEIEAVTGLQVEDTLVQPTEGGLAHVILSNMNGCSSCVNAGTVIGEAAEVDVVKGDNLIASDSSLNYLSLTELGSKLSVVRSIELVSSHQGKLQELISKPRLLDEGQMRELLNVVTSYHAAFCLDE